MSEINKLNITQEDGNIIRLTFVKTDYQPRASILILHGMAEHQNRYLTFAEYLAEQGYDAYLYDHRGHGLDRKFKELGFFASSKGDKVVVADAIDVCAYINKNNRSDKLILFGHSMGSLIARNVIQAYKKFHGVILCGTTHPSRFMTKMGLLISSLVKSFKGAKHKSPFMKQLLFGSKKYTKLSSRTAFDWLSRSNPVVGEYINDPYCGFTCTASFYYDLIKLTDHATRKKNMKKINREIPILIISGDRDPVGGYGKEIVKLVNILKKLQFSNLTYKLYQKCRHELLNELNYEEVYSDINQWISKSI